MEVWKIIKEIGDKLKEEGFTDLEYVMPNEKGIIEISFKDGNYSVKGKTYDKQYSFIPETKYESKGELKSIDEVYIVCLEILENVLSYMY